jgi:hypothetical protein
VSEPDDAELQRRLEALEAEVKAETAKKAAEAQRKKEIIAELRAREAAKKAQESPPARPKPKLEPKPKARPIAPEPEDEPSDFDTAMVVAKGAKMAVQAKKELEKPREKGQKSWLASSALSLFLGPVGWLYAGAFREAIPAAAIYVILGAILTKLPFFLVWPVMAVLLPVSAIAGLVYALQFNRNGKRTRIFDKDRDKKKLPAGD